MKVDRFIPHYVACLLGLLAPLTTASAQTSAQAVPTLVNYQGRLAKADGTVLEDGSYAITFRLFNKIRKDATEVRVWEETYSQIVVRNGVFSVLLGSLVPLRPTLFNSPVFLEIQIASNPPLTPRQIIGSVPYALRTENARVATTVDNGAITTAKLADSAVTGPKIANLAIGSGKLVSDAASLAKVSAGVVVSDGSNLTATGKLFISNHGSPQPPAIDLAIGDSDTGFNWIGDGALSLAANGQSVFEIFPEQIVAHRPLQVNGGIILSPGGMIRSTGRLHLYSGENIYINGNSPGTTYIGGDGGSGNLHVYGNLSKSSGSFRIDHPQDPENKYLYHSFVESPDMKNVYDGVATCNSRGEVTVKLPGYFETLNRDFRYQLTCIGGYSAVYVRKEVSGNEFEIAGGKPGLKVSWQVTGIRQDPWAEAHRIQVEVDKVGDERGKLSQPELARMYGSRR